MSIHPSIYLRMYNTYPSLGLPVTNLLCLYVNDYLSIHPSIHLRMYNTCPSLGLPVTNLLIKLKSIDILDHATLRSV